jgi:PAS domain S-box-containing protein
MIEVESGPSFEGDAPVAAEVYAVPDRRELALVAVERTRMPMVVSDPRQPDSPIVLANQAFLDLSGYDASEVIGRNCRFLQGPETDEADVEAIRRGLAAGEEFLTVELLNYRKNGSTFWNELSISPVYDAGGELIYYFGSQKDVTVRRRAEALEQTERLLLQEVDHRALNALAVAQSIVSLTRADTIGQFSSLVRSRIAVLARAHRLLANSGWATVHLADILQMEVPARFRAQVQSDGPTASIPATLVQPVSLVIHELMTNAVQHGALGNSGTLSVGWNTRPGAVDLRWSEQVTLSRPPTLSPQFGFGLSIAQGLIVQQLGGTLELEWAETGMSAAITLPANP